MSDQDLDTSDLIEIIDQDDGEAPNAERGDVLDSPPPAPEKEEAGANKDEQAQDESASDASGAESNRDKGGKFIPKPRFDEVNNQRKALAQENQALQERLRNFEQMQLSVPQIKDESGQLLDIEAAERRATELLMDGDQDSAIKMRMQINQAIAAGAYQQFVMAEGNAVLQDVANSALNAYPELIENEALLEEVIVMRDGYMQRGMSTAAALQKAVERVTRLLPSQAATETAPEPAKTPVPNKGEQRKTEAVARGVKTSESQPPASFQTGVSNRVDSGLMDVTKLSEKGFRALSEEDRARARGDII